MYYYFFFVPIGTDVTCRRRSLVTPLLVLANIGAYLVAEVILGDPRITYALAWKPSAPTLVSALTACFLHAGPLHLAGNMLYLLLLGPAVEDRLGRGRFLVMYLMSGVLAMVVQAAVVLTIAPSFADYPVVGASGAVAGVVGALLVRLPHARVRVASATLMLLHGVNKVGVRHLPVPVAVAAWMILQLAYGLFSPSGHTAYWSHLGGLLAGGALAVAGGALRAGRYERRLARAGRYMEGGGWFQACGEYESALRLTRDRDPAVLSAYARALVAAKRRGRAIRLYRDAVHGELKRGRMAAATALYQELERLLPAAGLHAGDQLKMARGLRMEGEFETSAQALLDFAESAEDPAQAEMARLLAAEILQQLLGDQEAAGAIYRDIDPRSLSPRWAECLALRRARGFTSRRSPEGNAA